MARGDNDDPIIINPTNVTTSTGLAVTVKLLKHFFTRSGFDADEFIEDVSPLIHPPIVNPGECFAFTVNTAIVFKMEKDEYGRFFFTRWPGLRNFPRYPVAPVEESRPWIPDVVGTIKGRIRGLLNPFSEADKLME